MKVLLTSLNSKYVHSNLALRYLYAAARPKCDSVQIEEFTINNDEDYIFAELLRDSYDVICFSCYIWNVEKTADFVDNLKKAQPSVKIILGGPEVGLDAVEFMKRHRSVDFVVTGEGEYAFGRLCEALEKGTTRFETIRGLVYRQEGKIYVNPPGDPLIFEAIPFPYEWTPFEKDKVVYYESVRGCPFGCSYCLSSLEKKMRALSLTRVFADLDVFLASGLKQVKFVDRTFNWDLCRSNEIMRYIMDRDNGVTNFHFELCGELIDDRFLELAARARPGLFQFEIGIQSTNKKTLAAINRSENVELLLQNIKKLTRLPNIHVHVDLIAGLPYEDYTVFQRSFNDAYALSADTLQLGFLKMLKGTPMREEADRYQYVYRKKAPYEVISNRFITAKDLTRLKQIETLLDLYYNRSGFERTLEYACKAFTMTAFRFYEEFSFFYALKGYQHESHGKEDLYRILYEYGSWKKRKLMLPGDGFERLLLADMERTLNAEAVKRFVRKGWEFGPGRKDWK